jgi:integrase
VLHFTGCRISEALSMTPRRVDLSGRAVVFEILKKRRTGVFRSVQIPPSPLDLLSKWMGHASLEVTAIYANALGAEERPIAERMWKEAS